LGHTEWAVVLGDFHRGRNYILVVLQQKLAYWQLLPWVLAGMASTSEEDARQKARAALEQFCKDPCQSCHHPVTWEYLEPGSLMRLGIDAFAKGTARGQLPTAVQVAIARLRFVPINGTSIEEKHARVKRRAKTQTNPRALQVGIAARLPAFESMLMADPLGAPRRCAQLLEHFGTLRSLRTISTILGVSEHPSLLGVHLHPEELNCLLRRIIYRTELSMMFESKAAASRTHSRIADRHRNRDAAAIAALGKAPDFSQTEFVRALMQEHLLELCEPGQVYSAPLELVRIAPLSTVLTEPASKRARCHEALMDGVEATPTEEDPDVFFSIVVARPHLKRRMQVPVGSGVYLSVQVSSSVAIRWWACVLVACAT